MNKKALLYVLLCNVSLLQSMETVPQITDSALQKLITAVNKDSLHMVNLVKNHIKNDYRLEVIPKNIPLVLELDQEHINDLFLHHVNDDDLRPMFLKMGADIKARGKGGYTCLHYANNPAAFKELINYGAEVDAMNDDKKTPLVELLYFSCDEETLENAQILLEHKANPHIDLGYWGSILHRVLDYKDATICFKTAQLLCAYNMNVNIKNENNQTPLSMAVNRGMADLVELFLPKVPKEEINAPNCYQECLLHVAMEKEEHFYYSRTKEVIPKIVILLLQYGADPNISYTDGKTMPLHVATDRGQWEIIKELINHGAHKHYKDTKNKTAYMIAQERGYKQNILDLLYTDIITHDENEEELVLVEHERNESHADDQIRTCILQ